MYRVEHVRYRCTLYMDVQGRTSKVPVLFICMYIVQGKTRKVPVLSICMHVQGRTRKAPVLSISMYRIELGWYLYSLYA